MIVTKIDKENKFIAKFDTETGMYIRTGVLLNHCGKPSCDKYVDTGKDPFLTSFPELLDIGIMAKCANAKNCDVGCYQGCMSDGENMSVSDYEKILKQCEGKVFQIALGGAGSPDEHEDFEEILKLTRKYGIVPNYTTSGIMVDKKTAELTKKYCGAVAVSWYKKDYTMKALEHFINTGCKTNIHFVLNRDSIDEAIMILKIKKFVDGSNKPPGYGDHNLPPEVRLFYREFINAIIFLTYKPIGLGVEEKSLDFVRDKEKIKEFVSLIGENHPFKVGFDSCAVPMLLYFYADVLPESIDTCEGGRFSGYIHHDMVMTPCSFDQGMEYGVSLRDHTVKEAWDSEEFERFRSSLREGCPRCEHNEMCMGGCPLFNEKKCGDWECSNETKSRFRDQ
jgi:radical SAM protein with 4Fe4S-binding SPASM domain